MGKVWLSNSEEILGVLGEPILCEGQKDITQYGGWRAYIATFESSKSSLGEV